LPITEELKANAHELGIRLEVIGGLSVWEANPPLIHHKAADRIRASIRHIKGPERECVHYHDLDLRFPDGSQTGPDIVIFCREPDEEDTEVTLPPEAVIAILSRGYEAKDLEIGVPFYRAQGVKDVIAFDPHTKWVLHVRGAETRELTSPIEIHLACGCVCTV
jgi:Uma2 family endonuclease